MVFVKSESQLAAVNVGFRFGPIGTHTSRTMMFDELQQLFSTASPHANRQGYAIEITDNNCLSKPTAATRRLTNQRLGEIYGLDTSIALFRILRRLWDLDTSGRRLLALLMALARDPLLLATAPSVVLLPLNSEFQRDATKTALQSVVGDRLSGSTLDKVCRNAASTWSQSGHLEGRTFKKRRAVEAMPTVVAFAVYIAQAAGFAGADVFSSDWLRVLDCDPARARQLALEAKRIGLLDLRMSGDIVELNSSRLDPKFAKT